MPRYYFHATCDGEIVDGEGQDLASVAEARRMAVHYAGDLMRDASSAIFESDLSVSVTDEHGLSLFTVHVMATSAAALAA